MGSIEQEKEYLYWLCRSLPAFAVTIRQIQETYGSFQQAYYIEGTQLWKKGIFKKEENALRFDAWKGEFSRLEEEYYKLSEKGIYFITPLDEEYPRRLYSAPQYNIQAVLYCNSSFSVRISPSRRFLNISSTVFSSAST